MRSDVKSSLLQAYGAAMMVNPFDDADLDELIVARAHIRAALRVWIAYNNGDVKAAQKESDSE